MRKLGVVLGIGFLGLGLFILIVAEGLRRWYSGLFFVLIGTISVVTALARKGDSE